MSSFSTGSDRIRAERWRQPRSGGVLICAAVLTACWGVVLISTAGAQQYRAYPVDEQARRLSGFMSTFVREPSRYAAEKDRFTDYFTKAYFPSMTQYGPKDLESLGKKRFDLFSDFLWKSSNEELRRNLTEIAYQFATRVVPDQAHNFHPAVRYNAVLILGMLDEVYGDDRANRPPKPLPRANSYLVNDVVGAAAEGEMVPSFVVVGALVGLERHARFGESLDPQQRAAMTAAIVKLLSNDPPLPDLDRDVSEWIKLRGATVLARLGSPGGNGEVHQTLLDLLAGKDGRKMTLDARCQLVALLGRINYDGASVDAKATAVQVLALAVDVAEAEAKRAKEFEDLRIGGGGFGGNYPGRGGRFSISGEPPPYDRRVLLARLGDLRTGLQAVKPLLSAEKQTAVDTILAAIKQATDAAENKNLIDLDVASRVRTTAREILQAANPGAAPADDAEPADEF